MKIRYICQEQWDFRSRDAAMVSKVDGVVCPFCVWIYVFNCESLKCYLHKSKNILKLTVENVFFLISKFLLKMIKLLNEKCLALFPLPSPPTTMHKNNVWYVTWCVGWYVKCKWHSNVESVNVLVCTFLLPSLIILEGRAASALNMKIDASKLDACTKLPILWDKEIHNW